MAPTRRPAPHARPTRPGALRRARWSIAALLLASFGPLGAGCSSSNADAPTGEDAARLVAGGFALDESVEACLSDEFDDADPAAEALALGGQASPGQRQALVDVMEACITPEVFATTLAENVTLAFPGIGAEQQECLRGAVLDLAPERRQLFMTGLALSADGQVDELDAEYGEVSSELLTSCQIVVEPRDSVPPTAAP